MPSPQNRRGTTNAKKDKVFILAQAKEGHKMEKIATALRTKYHIGSNGTNSNQDMSITL
jgi:hypothetical protein